jgi:hypothetical protein
VLGVQQNILIVLALIWAFSWKGVAMWKAARNNQPGWFISVLVINTLGLLEILYISFFQRDKN